MPYQSPLHILDDLEFAPGQINPEGLNRLRKKLLAEFSLNPAVTINVRGKAYTKDEILKTIDVLKATDNLEGHQYIFQNKNLLNWLENPTQVVMPTKEIKDLIAEKSDDSFLLDRIEAALYDKIKSCVRKRDFKAAGSPMSVVIALPFFHSSGVYDFLYNELQSIIDSINAARKRPDPNIAEDKKTFGFITFSDWTDFLNGLPDDFEGARDDYCRSAVNYSVGVQKKDREWVYHISHQLNQTQCDESLGDVIHDNHKIYTDNYSGSGTSDWGWVRIVLFILFVIFRMASCSKM